MEKFRKKIKWRMGYWGVLCLLFYLFLFIVWVQDLDEHRFAFFLGAASAISVFAVLMLMKNIRLLRNEKHLQEMYIKEMDERNQMVAMKTQSASFRIFILIVAMITIGYAFVDLEKSMVIAQVVWVAPLVKLITYWYYNKKL